mgnify:CR=1 FL=1
MGPVQSQLEDLGAVADSLARRWRPAELAAERPAAEQAPGKSASRRASDEPAGRLEPLW